MILIGRGLDLEKQGAGRRQKGVGEREKARAEARETKPETGTETERDCERMSRGEKRGCRGQAEKRGTPTCAVLRVREHLKFPVTIA